MAEGFEPSHGRINSAVPYQLGYATREHDGETEGRGDTEKRQRNLYLRVSLSPPSPRPFYGGDEGSRTLIVRFTRPTLCYPIELHRHLKLVNWEGVKPSQEVCRTSMLSVTSPARTFWWLWVELNHQPRAYETLALIPLELHSQEWSRVSSSIAVT